MKAVAGTLPDGLRSFTRTADFTEQSVPPAFLRDHATKDGSWGLIHVEQGRLRYRVTDARRAPFETVLTPESGPGVVEPTIRHRVAPLGAVLFHVEFFRPTD